MESVLPNPPDLGLPSKFPQWRHRQDEAALRAVDSPKRFVVLALSTGSGKSLAYMAAAMLQGGRTAFLTSTKGLQNQLSGDFHESGLTDIRGQANYPCAFPNLLEPTNADHGPCHAGVKCELQKGGCEYFDAVAIAKQSHLTVSNYQYWMHSTEHGQGLGTFGMLVCDEAHAAIDELSTYLSVELLPVEMEGLLGLGEMPDTDDFDWWKSNSQAWNFNVLARITHLKEAIGAEGHPGKRLLGEVRALKQLQTKLERVATAQGEWIVDVARRGKMGRLTAKFDPVWPADYAEKHLFNGIAKIILTSATVRPKTLELLGVKQSDVDFVEYPSVFPVSRRPVYLIPTVKMDNRATSEHKKIWMATIDGIIRTRLGAKGIIHTVSYDRASYILRHSDYSDHMLVHETKTAQETIRKFKSMPPPAILVSPSVTTGYDFPLSECDWQIISKVPFPDSRDKVLTARTKRDKDYGLYVTMQTIVQAAGRGMRSADDSCEVLIVDDNALWFLFRYKQFAPQWFMQSLKKVQVIPKPLEFSQVRSRSKSQSQTKEKP